MAFPFIAAAAGIGANLLGDVLDRSAAKKAKEDALNAWKALLIPVQDTERRADQYGDDVYTRTMGELNTGAFAYAGALNPETIRTLAFSKMGVARSQTETAVKEEDYKYNKQVQQQMAQIQAQPLPTIDVTGALGAGVAGYFGGKQLEMSEDLLNLNKEYIKSLTKTEPVTSFINPEAINIADTTLFDLQDPLKNKKKNKGLGLNTGIPNYGFLPSAIKYT